MKPNRRMIMILLTIIMFFCNRTPIGSAQEAAPTNQAVQVNVGINGYITTSGKMLWNITRSYYNPTSSTVMFEERLHIDQEYTTNFRIVVKSDDLQVAEKSLDRLIVKGVISPNEHLKLRYWLETFEYVWPIKYSGEGKLYDYTNNIGIYNGFDPQPYLSDVDVHIYLIDQFNQKSSIAKSFIHYESFERKPMELKPSFSNGKELEWSITNQDIKDNGLPRELELYIRAEARRNWQDYISVNLSLAAIIISIVTCLFLSKRSKE